MIAVDTSALLAILQKEPQARACFESLRSAEALVISAATLAEALIVAARRGIAGEMRGLLDGLPLTTIPVTTAVARRVAAAYDVWGRGVHPAKLNFGDCFAYEVASFHNCPLLFVGEDFSRTDIASALAL